jgi:hypothetical protein
MIWEWPSARAAFSSRQRPRRRPATAGAAGLVPIFTPQGRLRLASADDAGALPPEVRTRLLQLGAGEVGTPLPAVFSYWRDLGSLFVTALCTTPAAADRPVRGGVPAAPTEELASMAAELEAAWRSCP